MGMPIKLWNPNEQIVLPDEYVPGKPSVLSGLRPATIRRP